jgi:endonuclease YncB( thermonuclease family)
MRIFTTFSLAYILLTPALTFAHGGGLNKEGCHNNRQIGDYHCHRGAKAEPKKPNKPTLTGVPRIIDGDTIRIGNTRIRLHGIDAPEAKQTCTVGGKEWRCGREATDALVRIVGEHQVSCSQRDVGRYGRVVAVCWAGPVDLNAWMVRQGWAVAYRRYSKDYAPDEKTAGREKRGIWRGRFMPPWDWRRKNRR